MLMIQSSIEQDYRCQWFVSSYLSDEAALPGPMNGVLIDSSSLHLLPVLVGLLNHSQL